MTCEQRIIESAALQPTRATLDQQSDFYCITNQGCFSPPWVALEFNTICLNQANQSLLDVRPHQHTKGRCGLWLKRKKKETLAKLMQTRTRPVTQQTMPDLPPQIAVPLLFVEEGVAPSSFTDTSFHWKLQGRGSAEMFLRASVTRCHLACNAMQSRPL